MPNDVFDLDAVIVERVTIRKTLPGEAAPRAWDLRDDVPPEIMLRVFRLMKHSSDAGKTVQEIAAQTSQDDEDALVAATEEIERLLIAQDAEALQITLGIFQHSYPDITAEQLRVWFTHKEREAMVRLFFTRLLAGSSSPSSATTVTGPAATPNRAMRRSQAAKSRSSGSGAIPSQKRIKRDLGI